MKAITKLGGKIDFKVDEKRRIVYETNTGLWKKPEIEEYQKTHEQEVEPLLNKGGVVKPWAKISDIREYKMSMIVDEINNHSSWASKRGLTHVAMIVNDLASAKASLVKGQINRSATQGHKTEYFDTHEEAEKWLAQNGF
ncbi:hypothetical protein CLPU_1c02440 [Gottschalkia purinilytica]|uniref:STAS/SEC14 domain-containing protein n=1 Tax=Gottschalkia purinilytica TaxID=1503 RepID=A0A0L0WF31_GOTPU|nr:hypothetical protein [Gottschalkia purinilytica]KNF10079.1 hypothetical protein CLPU_1c02440 [Gottschalkia purinilytica]